MAQHELVGLVVLELAADEEDPRPSYHRAHRDEVQVVPTCGVIWREVVLEQGVLQYEMVGVRLVGGEEHERMVLAELVQLLERLRGVVDVAISKADHPAHQTGNGVDHERRVSGGDLLEIIAGAFSHLLDRHPVGFGELGNALLEAAALEQRLAHELRHLVAAATQGSLCTFEGEPRLQGHKL